MTNDVTNQVMRGRITHVRVGHRLHGKVFVKTHVLDELVETFKTHHPVPDKFEKVTLSNTQ